MDYEKNYSSFLRCARPIILTEFIGKLKTSITDGGDKEKIQKFREMINDISELDALSLKQLSSALVSIVDNRDCKQILQIQIQNMPKKLSVKMSEVQKHEMMYLFYLSRFTIEELAIKVDIQTDNISLLTKVISMCYCLVSVGAVGKVSFEMPASLEKDANNALAQVVVDSDVNQKLELEIEKLQNLEEINLKGDPSTTFQRSKNQKNQQLIITFMNFFRMNSPKHEIFKRIKVHAQSKEAGKVQLVMRPDAGDTLEIESEPTAGPKDIPPEEKDTRLKLRNPRKKQSKRKDVVSIEVKLDKIPASVLDELNREKILKKEQKALADLEQMMLEMGSVSPGVKEIHKETESQFKRHTRETIKFAETVNTRMGQSPAVPLILEVQRKVISSFPSKNNSNEKKIASNVTKYVNAYNEGKNLSDKINIGISTSTILHLYDKMLVPGEDSSADTVLRIIENVLLVNKKRTYEHNMISMFQEIVAMVDIYINRARHYLEITEGTTIRTKVDIIKNINNYITFREESYQLDVIIYALRICMGAHFDNEEHTSKGIIKKGTLAYIENHSHTYNNDHNHEKTIDAAAKVYTATGEQKDSDYAQLDDEYYDWMCHDTFFDAMDDIIFTLCANNFVFTTPDEFQKNYDQYLHCPIYDIVVNFDIVERFTRIAIVMPYMTGDVDSLIEKHGPTRIPIIDRLSIMHQMTSSIEHLNSIGIAHCDVKPANFLYLNLHDEDFVRDQKPLSELPFKYKIYTIDFGVSKTLESIKTLEKDPEYFPDYEYYDRVDAGNMALMMIGAKEVPLARYVEQSLQQPKQTQETYVPFDNDDDQVYTNLFRPPEVFMFDYQLPGESTTRMARGYANVNTFKNKVKSYVDTYHVMMQSGEVYALLMSLFVTNRPARPLDYLDIYLDMRVGIHIDKENTDQVSGMDKDTSRGFPKFSSYIHSARQDMFLDIGQQMQTNSYASQIEIAMLQFLLVHINMSPMNRPSFATIKRFLVLLMDEAYKLKKDEELLNMGLESMSFKTSNDKKSTVSEESSDDDEDDEYKVKKNNSMCVLI